MLSLNNLWTLLFGPRPARPAPAPASPPVPPVVPAGDLDGQVIALVNAARARVSLPALAADPGLREIANSWAGVMASTGDLTHGDFPGRIATVHPNTAAGEDIAEGYPTAPAVVAGWMASPPHRANILGPYRTIGVGHASGAAGAVYFCADFDKF